jgi:hypothetical protein
MIVRAVRTWVAKRDLCARALTARTTRHLTLPARAEVAADPSRGTGSPDGAGSPF